MRELLDTGEVHRFATKWCDKFRNQQINYIELVDRQMADECEALGFKMDSGEGFSKRYGNAVSDNEELDKIIDNIDDIELLGSAIYSRWRYFNHWAYDGEEILTFKNRSWFILALSRLAILTGRDPFIFEGEPKTIHILSNNLGYGPLPLPTDEIEQELTISADGQVKFTSFKFGDRGGYYQKARSKEFNIGKAGAGKIIKAVGKYFSQEYTEIFATDIGDWKLEIINSAGESYYFRGSLCAALEMDGIDLSDLIRDQVGLDDLFVFDGKVTRDRVTKITIDYHKVSRIQSKEPISEAEEYLTIDYMESLIIDRDTETLEYIRTIKPETIISHKFQVQGEVEALLDDLEAERLFAYIEGNPDDVIENPKQSRDYKISVDFEKGSQRTISGSYDKKGLPEDWADFAEAILEFILSFGLGEVLNPSVYNLIKRRQNDYIFCSVSFAEGDKTYYYLTDDDSIEIGDYVRVPVGADNRLARVRVEKIEYFNEDQVPMPISKIKRIPRKCSNEDD